MKMRSKMLFGFFVITMLLVGNVYATGLSIQLKRTNPGVVGETPAELIFDIVNTDMTHEIEGFIWCKSPDDATVSSTHGAASGSGAQYVGPKFVMDTGPSQKSMTLTINAVTPGDKRTGCIIKYAPLKEITTGETTKTKETTDTDTIDTTGTEILGFTVKLAGFSAAVEATNETSAVPAKAIIDVDGTSKEIELGSSAKIGSLTITVKDATENSATVKITSSETVTIAGTTTKQYLKMNGKYVTTLEDSQYREIRLDKTIPFVEKMSNPQCPDGKTTCSASEVVDVGGVGVPSNWLLIAGALVVLAVVFLAGKASR